MRNHLLAGLVLLLLITLSPATLRAETPKDYPDSKSLVAGILDKMKGISDYSLVADIQGPVQEAVIDYRCVRPSDIRTEILDGPHRGAIIVYLPRVKDKMVKVRTGNKRLWRSIDKLKIAGTPMVQSVLDTFANDLATYTLTMKSHQKVSIDVGKPVKTVPNSGEPDMMGDDRELPKTSPDPQATSFNRETVEKDCYVLEGVKEGTHLVLAVDSSTLWPVTIKQWKGKKPAYEARIWRMSINTSPKIDF